MEDMVIVEQNDFSQVIFECADESYSENQQLECAFTLNELLKVDVNDYIGIFKVGFTNCKEYYTQQYLNVDELTGSTKGRVIFASEQVPKDDGEFYQFVYVSRNKQIRGASIPFQFKKTHASDFVCVDEEHDGILIKSKENALNEQLADLKMKCDNLAKSNETYERLVKDNEHMINYLKNEIISLKMRSTSVYGESEKIAYELRARTQELNELNEENVLLRRRFEELSNENRNLIDVVKCRMTQSETLEKDKNDLEVKLREADVLKKEKNDLEAKLRETEDALAESKREKEDLQKLSNELLLTNNKVISLEKSFRDKVDELKHNEVTVTEQQQTIKCLLIERDTLNSEKELLSQELCMTRDKLNANEDCKQMLKTQLSMSTHELEQTKHELVKERTQVNEIKRERDELLKKIDQINEERKSLANEQNGSYYALQLANTHLEKRLNTYKQESNEQKLKARELSDECDELKQRLRAGAEEYTNLNRKYLRLKNIIHSSKIRKEIKREYTLDDLASQLSDSGVMRKESSSVVTQSLANDTQYSPSQDESTLKQYALSSIYSTMNQPKPNQSTPSTVAPSQIPNQLEERLTASAISRIQSTSVGDNHLIDLYFDRHALASSTQQQMHTQSSQMDDANLKTINEDIGKCEICSFEFPIDMTESIYEEHFASHFGPKCPICFFRFRKGYPQAEFESHVNSHF